MTNKILEGMARAARINAVESDEEAMQSALLWLANEFTANSEMSTLVKLPGGELVRSAVLVAAALRQAAGGGDE